MKCLNCSRNNPDEAIYCQICGTYLAERSSSDLIDLLRSLVLALIFTSVFYLVFPLPQIKSDYIHELLDGRISELIFGLSCWAIFLVFFKWRHHRLQLKTYLAFRQKELTDSLSEGIFVKDVDSRIEQIGTYLAKKRIKRFQVSVLFIRVRRILHYLRVVPKKEELHQILNYQAEIDFNRLQNGYTLINVLIWAIPILGFIGTVFGIGQSVGEFSTFVRSMDTAAIGGQMRSALGGVTSGLSIAFNTTFLALVSVIPIMLLSSLLRKSQEDLLLKVEEYCLDELLPNLHVNPGDEELKNRTNEHLSTLNDFTENWLKRIAPVLTSVSENSEVLQAQIQGMQPLLRDYSDEIIHKAPSEPDNKSDSPEALESEVETSEVEIDPISSSDMELGLKFPEKSSEIPSDSKQGDFSLNKPEV
ncbi:MAG: MotA/TolQ/ExbB proton channel family protein [Deltaproteobacteria bacterium]